MSIDITNLAVDPTLLANIAFAGASVEVRRIHHFEIDNPVKADGIKLVSFDGKIKHFADHDQASSGSDNILDDLAQHSKATGLDTTGAIAIGVYRYVKGDTVLTCNPAYKKNELMGLAYVTKDYLAENFGDDFTIEDSMRLTLRIDAALRNLTAWQCDNIYQISFSKNDTPLFKSKVYYSADMTDELITDLLDRINLTA